MNRKLSSTKQKNNANRSFRVLCKPEQLEERRCFNVDIGIANHGHTLEIEGDRANDSIVIVQDNAGVHVTANGGRTQDFSGISKVIVNSGAGDDVVSIRTLVDPSERSIIDPNNRNLDIAVNLGAGNDRFDGVFGAQAGLRMNVNGGAGDDVLNSQIVGSIGELVPAVAPNPIEFHFLGGAGDDTFKTLIGGSNEQLIPAVMPTPIVIVQDGGAGDDTFSNTIRNVQLNGHVRLNIDGGAGDDRILETFDHAHINAGLDLDVLGGQGDDELGLIGQPRIVTERGFDPSFVAMSQVRMRFDGGAGNDRISGEITPCVLPAGLLDMVFAGGAGDDIFDFDFQFEASAKSPNRYGAIAISVLGGAGVDQLHLKTENLTSSVSPISLRTESIERLQ